MKRYTVIIAKAAQNDLKEIYDYIAQHDSTEAAKRVYSELKKACLSLSILPYRGSKPHELHGVDTRYRNVIHKSYRVFYLIDEGAGQVHIDAILDGRRNIDFYLENL